ncbi:MAG: hypothetical protein CVU95_08750 [Firmicutes bacterium HGW-Firmicutes-2]|jgi:hypothetical protein|nr:MAG: hypothetical protein CVU95_08750 [Firmicutes bacterium HGW-Firmicutes-2]PKP50442.1 MAG: hypothetical protein CVT92_14435 [Bacteroidetes bacterium HGW-Bacteroidetes-1]
MKKLGRKFKKVLEFMFKYFPIMGGYSTKDADDLMKDPDHYNYRDMSWVKAQEDKWLNRDKK